MSTSVTLDTEKHVEIRRAQRYRHDYSTGSEDFSDDDEFGGAIEGEAPDSQYLISMKTEYEEEEEVMPTMMRLTNSQLQAHLPMGLDKGKHEDIGGLLIDASAAKATASKKHKDESLSSNNSNDEFGDADDHDLPVPHCLAESDHDPSRRVASQIREHIPLGIDSEKHEEIGHLMDSRHDEVLEYSQDTLDEFGDANEYDVPVNKYLQDAKELILMEDKIVSRRVTPSQLQAHIPSGLDNEKHEEIGDLMDSGHDNDEQEEFGDADEHDIPHRRFLHDSTHSIPFDDGDNYYTDHRARISGIDTQEQKCLSKRSNYIDNTEERQGNRSNESRNNDEDEDDELESDIEYEDLKGSDTLDTEKHDDLGDLNDVISDDGDEFESAGVDDVPVQKYLLSQRSLHGDDLKHVGIEQVLQGLDHETHEDLGGFRMSAMSDDEEEFESADSFDKPSSAFLQHQISIQDDQFLSSEEIQQVEDEIVDVPNS